LQVHIRPGDRAYTCLMNRFMIAAAITFTACGSSDASDGRSSASAISASAFRAPKPHDKVDGPAMYRIDLEEIAYQRVDEQDKPVGDPMPVAVSRSGESRCRIEKDPGSDGISTWFTRYRAETGGSIDLNVQDKTADSEVLNCVVGAVINTKFEAGPGRYKVSAKAWFSSPQKQ